MKCSFYILVNVYKKMKLNLYRYTSHTGCYKDDIISKNQLWFSCTLDINDPLDSNLDYRQDYSIEEIKVF